MNSKRRLVVAIIGIAAASATALVLQRWEGARADRRAVERAAAVEAYAAGRHEEAFSRLAAIADRGAGPRLLLARLHAEGLGTPRDPARARALLEELALGGEVEAFAALADLLAHAWANLAASRFGRDEAAGRADAVALREEIERQLAPEERRDARLAARRLHDGRD